MPSLPATIFDSMATRNIESLISVIRSQMITNTT